MSERPIDRGMLEILTDAECWERVSRERVGRVAFVEQGQPTVLPVNHARDDRTVLFPVAPGGRRSSRPIEGPVAFEVDGYDADARTGWSVLIHGQARELSAADAVERLVQLERAPRGDRAHASRWIEVRAEHVSGRRIPRRDDA